MSFSAQLREAIKDRHLLSHPFYQAWTEGRLTKMQLQEYAVAYKPFVEAFPRFVSAVHSRCEDAKQREELLENLMDEEGKTGRGPAHPILWQDFIDGLGGKEAAGADAAGVKARDTYLRLTQSSYEEGLCALYAYEYQTPAISGTKIEGLKKFYNIDDARTLEFFRTHEIADVYHSRTCEQIIDAIPADKQAAALKAAREASEALWNFLSEAYGEECACAA
ncbi:MAG TPA: CADD family putative folate metabolism protein [Alphaproteobacteria bacterium]|nr:CADD family putative folate metabolism protein [Alphaproteobacteria bacterium]